jgi:ATP-dependent helicase HrpA
LPERITVSGEPPTRPSATLCPSDGERDGVRGGPEKVATPVYAWPGLALEEGHVNVRLFRSPELSRAASLDGLRRLVELAIHKDLGWLQKDLRALSKCDALHAPLGSAADLQASAFEHLKRYVLTAEPLALLTKTAFDNAVTQAQERLRGLTPQLVDRVTAILQLRQQIAARLGPAGAPAAKHARTLTDLSKLGQPAAHKPGHPLAAELHALLPARFLEQIDFDRLPHLARFLKALLIRIERAAVNPPKDQERARQLAPFVEAVKKFQAAPPKSAESRRLVEEFRWLVEEFKVSLFAQELGTAVPVSAKRLEQQLEQLRVLA